MITIPKPPILAPLLAHRGMPHRAPENTFASFKLAIAESIRWIECDVQLLSDGTFALFHDEDLHRCTNGTGMLYSETAESLQKLSAGSWFSNEFSFEKVPLLENYLDFIVENDSYTNLELKLSQYPDPHQWIVQFTQVLKKKPEAINRLLVSSFDRELLVWLRRYDKNIPLALNEEESTADFIEFTQKHLIGGYHINYKNLNHIVAKSCEINTIDLRIYTVNTIKQLLDSLKSIEPYRVAGVFSDCPDIFNYPET